MLEQSILPCVVVLATGGTIAGVQSHDRTARYKAGALSGSILLEAVPELAGLAQIRVEQIANIGSQNMSHAIWEALALRIDVLEQDTTVQGIVITHGTDTLEETAYFLSLITRAYKPVVLVGAMRPATALGAEGPANLYNAVALATSPAACGRGPLVVMNEDIHYAREAQKIASMGINAFASPNRGRAGVMHSGQPYFFSSNTTRHTRNSEFTLSALRSAAWPRVDIVYAHAGMDGFMIDTLIHHAAGIVLAGVGDGNATDVALAALTRAAKTGVAVVRASRTGSGLVARDVEVDDTGLGFVAAGELNPQKARVLLMLVLSISHDLRDWRRCFAQY